MFSPASIEECCATLLRLKPHAVVLRSTTSNSGFDFVFHTNPSNRKEPGFWLLSHYENNDGEIKMVRFMLPLLFMGLLCVPASATWATEKPSGNVHIVLTYFRM